MAHSVSAFALMLLRDEAQALRALQSPVLVWEAGASSAPPSEDPEQDTLYITVSGYNRDKPRLGDPVFFPVLKLTQRANPFTMGVTIGRAETNDITLEHGSVSRFHAYLQKDGRSEAWRIVDAESKNGTWAGPLKLTPQVPHAVADGTRLRFGQVELIFRSKESFIAQLRGKLRAEPSSG